MRILSAFRSEDQSRRTNCFSSELTSAILFAQERMQLCVFQLQMAFLRSVPCFLRVGTQISIVTWILWVIYVVSANSRVSQSAWDVPTSNSVKQPLPARNR